jgi:hypothetical protein
MDCQNQARSSRSSGTSNSGDSETATGDRHPITRRIRETAGGLVSSPRHAPQTAGIPGLSPGDRGSPKWRDRRAIHIPRDRLRILQIRRRFNFAYASSNPLRPATHSGQFGNVRSLGEMPRHCGALGRRLYHGDQNGRIFGPFHALTGPQSPVGFFECPDFTGAMPEAAAATLNSPAASTRFTS